MTVHPELSPAYLHMSQQEFDTRRDLAKDLVVKIAALDSEKLKVWFYLYSIYKSAWKMCLINIMHS